MMATGRSNSPAAMRLNQAAFGTAEARHWFLSVLQPPGTSSVDPKLTLRLAFDDFYTRIMQYRNGVADADAAKALTKEELRKVNLRTRDSSRQALAAELRYIMGKFLTMLYRRILLMVI